MDTKKDVEEWFGRRSLTLDLVGMSDQEQKEGSIFLGGSTAHFVVPGDKFEYSKVGTVVFRWGDSSVEDVMAKMLEHDDNPDESILFPFSASTVVGNDLWMLAVQDRLFDPNTAYRSQSEYVVMPFDDSGEENLRAFLNLPPPRPQLIGKVGPRWVLFEMGLDLHK